MGAILGADSPPARRFVAEMGHLALRPAASGTAVHLTPMPDFDDEHEQHGGTHLVQHPVVSDAEPVVLVAGQPRGGRRVRVACKSPDAWREPELLVEKSCPGPLLKPTETPGTAHGILPARLAIVNRALIPLYI